MLPRNSNDAPVGSIGMHLLESLRSEYAALPLVVLSAYLEPYAGQLTRLGVSAFISKGSPTSLEELLFQIRRAIAARTNDLREQPEQLSILSNLRNLIVEEIDRYSPVKERTIYIPQEGQYELIKPLVGFKRDIESQIARFPFSSNVFLMTKFRSSNRELGEYIIENLANHGLLGVRADHEQWNVTKNVYNPIAVLYCCKYGIALFDEAEAHQAYSPNVAYELGMMHYQNKHCLILRHNSLPIVPFDLIKDLYENYERDLQVRHIIDKWIKQIAFRA